MESLKKFGKCYKANAKINVFLKVLGKRKDGFHEIFSYILPIRFYDEIYFKETKRDEIEVETLNEEIKKEENLVYKGAVKLLEYAREKKGVKIIIKKNIPLGSGLGGGSSDCAVTLKFLNKFWRCNLNKKELIRIGAEIGSDVPFFIINKPAIVEGRGEIIKFKKIKLDLPNKIILFCPKLKIQTKKVYEKWDEINKKKEIFFNKNSYLKNLRIENLENDLQNPAFSLSEELKNIYEKIKETRPDFLIMSGSGSSFWGFYKNEKKLNEARGLLTNFLKFYIVFI